VSLLLARWVRPGHRGRARDRLGRLQPCSFACHRGAHLAYGAVMILGRRTSPTPSTSTESRSGSAYVPRPARALISVRSTAASTRVPAQGHRADRHLIVSWG